MNYKAAKIVTIAVAPTLLCN